MSQFELIGYFKEYYVGTNFIGTLTCDKDREVFGYAGKKTEKVNEKITFRNKKSLKAGQEVITLLFPLQGRKV
jgi:hypothetical protein